MRLAHDMYRIAEKRIEEDRLARFAAVEEQWLDLMGVVALHAKCGKTTVEIQLDSIHPILIERLKYEGFEETHYVNPWASGEVLNISWNLSAL